MIGKMRSDDRRLSRCLSECKAIAQFMVHTIIYYMPPIECTGQQCKKKGNTGDAGELTSLPDVTREE
jgi:hypothetical protein